MALSRAVPTHGPWANIWVMSAVAAATAFFVAKGIRTCLSIKQ